MESNKHTGAFPLGRFGILFLDEDVCDVGTLPVPGVPLSILRS